MTLLDQLQDQLETLNIAYIRDGPELGFVYQERGFVVVELSDIGIVWKELPGGGLIVASEGEKCTPP